MKRAMFAVALATLVACGEGKDPPRLQDASVDGDAPHDGYVASGPCWPDVERTPHGEVTLGTGRETFQPMPEELPLDYGSQDGFMLFAHVRMSGFEPGDPTNILHPTNPRTRIRAFFDETNIPLNHYANCPTRLAYVDTGNGYELAEGFPVVFETCWRANHLFDKRIRIELELTDPSGQKYVAETKVVTAKPPTGFHIVDEGTGCDHSMEGRSPE